VKLLYTRPALDDLKEIANYLDPRSPQGARQVRHRIKTLIEQLPHQPFLGKRTEDPTIRRLITTPYPFLSSMKLPPASSSYTPSVTALATR
jgi:toxin ParE1/3/4